MPADDQTFNVPRVIDFRIPLPWLLSVLGGLALLVIMMWVQGNRLQEEVRDLKIEVKTWNNQASSLAGRIEIVQFRVGTVESELSMMKGQPARPVERSAK